MTMLSVLFLVAIVKSSELAVGQSIPKAADPVHPCMRKLCTSCDINGAETKYSSQFGENMDVEECKWACMARRDCLGIDFGKGNRKGQCYLNTAQNTAHTPHANFDAWAKLTKSECEAELAKEDWLSWNLRTRDYARWRNDGCKWHGTAPFCNGQCPAHLDKVDCMAAVSAMTVEGTWKKDFGDDCWLGGAKAYCCPKKPGNQHSHSCGGKQHDFLFDLYTTELEVGTLSEHDRLKKTNEALKDALRALAAN